jgi:putative membrane protein
MVDLASLRGGGVGRGDPSIQLEVKGHDLRIADLPLRAGPHAGAVVAVREQGAADLGEHGIRHDDDRWPTRAAIRAPQEVNMLIRFSAAIAAMTLLGSPALAEGIKLTDPQIAHIAYTAGVIDVAAGKQALSKASNKEVKAFAESMVRDHEAVNKLALDLVKKLNVTPEDNDTSKTLSKQAADKSAELSKLSGAAFDKVYVANEIAYHKAVNGVLETQLIPSANNPELKNLLQTGLKIFQGHQQHAEHIAAGLK